MPNKKQKKHNLPFLFLPGLVLGLAVAILLFNIAYAQKIYPRVKAANLNLGNKTSEEARAILEARVNYFQAQGLKIVYKEREWPLAKDDLGLIFDLDATLNNALSFGHEKNIIKRLRNQTRLLVSPIDIPMQYGLDEAKLDQYLKNNLTSLETKPESAKIVLSESAHFQIIPEKNGQTIDWLRLKKEITENLDHLQDQRIEISLETSEPEIKKEGAKEARDTAEEMIALPLKLSCDQKYWTVPAKTIVAWIDFQANENEVLEADLAQETLAAFLKSLAPEIEQEAKNSRFKIKDGRVIAFEVGQEGKKIDLEETKELIKNSLQTKTQENEKNAEIAVSIITPNTASADINDLGIKTLIGSGESDFTGSPANRKHNIGVGAEKFNGVLIAPNEEFSIIQTLGEVSGGTGYKPELVIKPEGTIPEFGGGLCQVSTTLFRAAIYAGLPITERKAHKYVVSYYKPTGMDATIYIPHPDLRFQNNTPGYILIQKRIEGNKLAFDFYGTPDGRKVEIDGPHYTSAWVNPSPAEYIETNTLKKGEKKQVEKEHQGISTVFHRLVTRDNEEILKDSFYSKYQPWNAVFLVGTGNAPATPAPAPKTPAPPAENKKTPPQGEE